MKLKEASQNRSPKFSTGVTLADKMQNVKTDQSQVSFDLKVYEVG